MDTLFFDTSVDSYLYESAYFDFINNKIESEEAIARHLSKYIPMNEAAYSNLRAINEAKLSDKIKSSWQKFINFIKGIFGKFMESCTKILYDEKGYLVKYKDIILNKKPKDIEYSYVGDFDKGIQRCMDAKLPVFNWKDHGKACLSESDAEIVKKITPNMHYDTGNEDLAQQFKDYFFGAEEGKVSKGKFSDLNFKAMYNFCYNFDKIDQMVKTDIKHLEQSTAAIESKIKEDISNKGENTVTDTTKQNSTEDETKPSTATDESYLFEVETQDNSGKNNEGETRNGSLEINTNAISKMNSYKDSENDSTDEEVAKNAKGGSDSDEESVAKACQHWQTVCKAMLTAKCTAVQNIANTYMKIIRTHVRSYIGNSKNPEDNRDKAEKTEDYKTTEEKNQENK